MPWITNFAAGAQAQSVIMENHPPPRESYASHTVPATRQTGYRSIMRYPSLLG